MVAKKFAAFIEPMLLLRSSELPDGPEWIREIKQDGFRAVAFKSGGKVQLRSCNDKPFTDKYPALVKALNPIPNDTVIDGEVVALDGTGRPSFGALQNYGSSGGPLLFYIFDVMVLAGKDVMGETLASRRALIERKLLLRLSDPVRYSPALPGTMRDLLEEVKAQGFEGLVAKRLDSRYESGQRSGA